MTNFEIIALYWSVILSSILGFVKIYEFIDSQKKKIGITYEVEYIPEGEDVRSLLISNNSTVPITISYLKIFWLRKNWFGRTKEIRQVYPDNSDRMSNRIEAFGNITIRINDPDDNFDRPTGFEKAKLYAAISLLNDKCVTMRVNF